MMPCHILAPPLPATIARLPSPRPHPPPLPQHMSTAPLPPSTPFLSPTEIVSVFCLVPSPLPNRLFFHQTRSFRCALPPRSQIYNRSFQLFPEVARRVILFCFFPPNFFEAAPAPELCEKPETPPKEKKKKKKASVKKRGGRQCQLQRQQQHRHRRYDEFRMLPRARSLDIVAHR